MNEKEELEALEIEGAKIGLQCMESYYMFFKTFWPEFSGETYIDNFHIKLICDRLQEYGLKIANGEEIRKTLIINVPPGSSKSTMCTVGFPLWMWLHKPSCSTVNISFSADLSKDHQTLSKNTPESKRWKLLFDKILEIKYKKPIKITMCNEAQVQNNFGGKRFNASTSSNKVTGRHCDIIIEDDPLDPEQAFSDAERAKAIRFHDKTVSTRKKNDNCYLNIIIAQRLHEKDVCGHVLTKNMDIDHICLPGEITKNTPVYPEEARKFYIDGILNPIRKGRVVLNDLKESLGADGYAIQVLQLPFDLEAQDIKPEMFKRIHKKELPGDMFFDVWIDGAFTTKKNVNDPTGIDLISKNGKQIFVRKAYDIWKKLPDVIKFIQKLDKDGMFDAKQSRIFIEPKASGYPLAQYLEEETEYNFVLIGEHNKKEAKLIAQGKGARHEMIKPKAESGRVVLVEDGIDDSWIDDYVTQICGFPRASHDEHVDTLGYAINHYYMKESTFIKDWALRKLEKLVVGYLPVLITSQIVKSRNGNSSSMAVEIEENDSGNIQLYDNPSTKFKNRYITVVVMKSEAERGGTSVILVYDRQANSVVAMYDEDVINPRKIAYKALELSYLYDKAKLVVATKKTVGSAQNEELDLSHMIIQEIRKIGYDYLHSRLTINSIEKTREREFGFEVNRSSAREIYINLKDKAETNKINEIPLSVFEDISVLERKKETGEIDGQEGKEINRALAYGIALKVSDEWQDKVLIKNAKGNRWA